MEEYISQNRASGPNSNTKTEPFVKIIAIISTIGGLLFGYDTGVIAGAIIFMETELQLTPFTTGIVISSLLLGAAFGALLSGKFADRAGRKKIILFLAILFVIGALGTGLAKTVEVMIFFRIVLGFAVGGASATVPIYIAEIAPANKRGQLVTLQELMIVSGQLLAYMSNAVFHEVWGGDTSWRWMLAIASIPAILLFFGMLFMPDTPRWYALHGRFAEARKVLEKTRAAEDIDWEMIEIEETVRAQEKEKGTFKELLASKWVLKVFFLGIGIAMIQQLTGVNAIMYYAPTMLKATGMSTDAALFCTIANGVISVLMTFVGIWLLGFVGRRTLTIVGQLGCTCCLCVIIAVLFLLPETTATGGANLTRSYLVLLGMILFLCFQQGALSPVTWLLLSEVFPMKFRGLCMGSAIFMMWMTNFIISFLFPILLDALGLGGAFVCFASVGLFGAVFVIKCVPETRGRSLEQVEQYFKEKYTSK